MLDENMWAIGVGVVPTNPTQDLFLDLWMKRAIWPFLALFLWAALALGCITFARFNVITACMLSYPTKIPDPANTLSMLVQHTNLKERRPNLVQRCRRSGILRDNAQPCTY